MLAPPAHSLRPEQPKIDLIYLLYSAVGLVLWALLYYWLKPAADFLTYNVFKLPASSHLGSSVAFFLYDVPKVMLLLVLIIFGVGIIRSFFTPERTRQMLAGKREFTGNVLASGLGIVTPFCSCSACPLFIGFLETGIPLGITLSFLIASPMINEVARCSALRHVRLENRFNLRSNRTHHSHNCRVGDRQTENGEVHRRLGIRC